MSINESCDEEWSDKMDDFEKIDYDYAVKPVLKIKPGKKYRVVIHKGAEVHYVEVPDILFNHNSAVPCLDADGWLVSAVVTALKYAQTNPGMAAVLLGHADTSGQINYNYEISELRALAVKAILTNDESLWKEIVQKKNDVKDYQLTLKSLSAGYGWNCDPGDVDGKVGPKTKKAIKGFKNEANSRYGLNLADSEDMDDETWGAVLQVIVHLTGEQLGGESLPGIQWTYENHDGVYACGESFPIEDAQKSNYRSEKNRRAEIIFGKPGFFDSMPEPDRKRLLTRDECPVLNHELFIWTLIENELLVDRPCSAVIQDPVAGGLASLQVTIRFADGTTDSKTTDAGGHLVFECPKDQKKVVLEYKRGEKEYHLDFFPRPAPIDTDDGIWQRLVNLGYWGETEAPSSPSKEQLQAAVQGFQMDFEIDATGEIDPKTQDELIEISSENTYWKDQNFSTVDSADDEKPKEKVA